jgi:hypothetical protein
MGEIEKLLEELQSQDTPTVSNALDKIKRNPTGDKRIWEAIENLFVDKRFLIVEIKPIRYGEIGWLAGFTLSHEYAKAGFPSHAQIQVANTFAPLTHEEINKLSSTEDTKAARQQGGGVEKLLRIMDDKKKLKRTGYTFLILLAQINLKNRENR